MNKDIEKFKLIKDDYSIELGNYKNIDEIEKLYDDLNDYLESTTNYSGWKKGIYPVRQTAIDAIRNECLFILKIDKEIAATVILDHKQDPTYSQVSWRLVCDPEQVLVVHTFAINPRYMKMGLGKKIIEFIESYAKQLKMKSIRLDVAVENVPAIGLYEKSGYRYVGTVDLGLIKLDTKFFKLYEFITI